MPPDRRWVYRYRSSVTGRFVSREYAEAHPDTTQRFRVEVSTPEAARE